MNKSQSYTHNIIKGGVGVLLFALLTSPIGYLIRVLYSQTLSIEMYGLFYAVQGLFFIVTTYNDLGFGYSVSYLLPKYIKNKDYQSSWKIYMYCQAIEIASSIIISIVLILLSSWLEINYFKAPGARTLVLIFCVYLIGSSFLNALLKVFLGLQQGIYYSSIHFVRLAFALFFSFLFWFFDNPNIISYAISWSVSCILTAIIYNFLLYKKNSLLVKNPVSWDNQLFKKMYVFAVPTLITTSISSFIIFSDTFFLTLFKGVKDVGVYNVILPLVSISNIFLSPLSNFLLPIISHSMEGEQEKVKSALEAILKIIPFIGLYFGLFIIMFPSVPVSLLFGQKWVELVVAPLAIFAFGYIFSLLSNYLMTIASGMGKIKERLYATIIIAITCVILNAIFALKYGVIGVVFANSIVYILSVIIFGEIIRKVIPFRYPIKFYLKLTLFSLILFSIIKMLRFYPQGWLQYIFAGSLYSLAIIILAYYLKLLKLNICLNLFYNRALEKLKNIL